MQRHNVPLDKPETEEERLQRHTSLLKECNWRIAPDQRNSYCLLPPRNHKRLVPFVSWMLMGIGANVDQQVRNAEGERLLRDSDYNAVFGREVVRRSLCGVNSALYKRLNRPWRGNVRRSSSTKKP